MRRWLRDPLPETPEIPETLETSPSREVSGISGVSGSPLRILKVVPAGGPGLEGELEERAALIEHDGGVPRVLAEALAHLEARPWPAWCEASRWQELVHTFAHMIEGGSAAQAIAADWSLVELVGVQVQEPHDLPSRAGLIFSLRPGDTVTDVRRSGCAIVYCGGRHIWLRRPFPLGADAVACLPWELSK